MKFIIRIAGLFVVLFSLNNVNLVFSEEIEEQISALPVEDFIPPTVEDFIPPTPVPPTPVPPTPVPPTPVPPTPVPPTPVSPKPTPNEEDLSCHYQIEFNYGHDQGGRAPQVVEGDASELDCMEQIIEDALDNTINIGRESFIQDLRSRGIRGKLYAESIALGDRLLEAFRNNPTKMAAGEEYSWFVHNGFHEDYKNIPMNIRHVFGNFLEKLDNNMYRQILFMLTGSPNPQSASFNVFIDDQCQIVPNYDTDRICGEAKVGYYQSPISLIWEEGTNINEKLSFVEFALNPNESGLWYTWKASSKTPLLVYTPNGNINDISGAQLFGNWTDFGQNKLASLKPKVQSTNQALGKWFRSFGNYGFK